MKKYRVWDNYEGYGIVGDYDTEKEARAAAKRRSEETDGECQIVLYSYCEKEKGYRAVV